MTRREAQALFALFSGTIIGLIVGPLFTLILIG